VTSRVRVRQQTVLYRNRQPMQGECSPSQMQSSTVRKRSPQGLRDLAQAIIDTSIIATKPNVYLIDNFSGRINFFAHQTRALNLIWAFIQTK
jgi:hypothetical protein